MLERMFVVGNASLLLISAIFFFLIVIRVVRYKNKKDLSNKDFRRDEMNSYLSFILVTMFLSLALVLAAVHKTTLASLFFFCSFATLVYFFYYTCKVLYEWSKM